MSASHYSAQVYSTFKYISAIQVQGLIRTRDKFHKNNSLRYFSVNKIVLYEFLSDDVIIIDEIYTSNFLQALLHSRLAAVSPVATTVLKVLKVQ